MNITSKIYLTPIGQIAIVPHQYRYRTIPSLVTDFSRYRYGTGILIVILSLTYQYECIYVWTYMLFILKNVYGTVPGIINRQITDRYGTVPYKYHTVLILLWFQEYSRVV